MQEQKEERKVFFYVILAEVICHNVEILKTAVDHADLSQLENFIVTNAHKMHTKSDLFHRDLLKWHDNICQCSLEKQYMICLLETFLRKPYRALIKFAITIFRLNFVHIYTVMTKYHPACKDALCICSIYSINYALMKSTQAPHPNITFFVNIPLSHQCK